MDIVPLTAARAKTLERELLCSGPPWFKFDGQLPPCGNVAQVLLEDRGAWRRPMCVDCAEALDRHLAEQELAPALFSVIAEFADPSSPAASVPPHGKETTP